MAHRRRTLSDAPYPEPTPDEEQDREEPETEEDTGETPDPEEAETDEEAPPRPAEAQGEPAPVIDKPKFIPEHRVAEDDHTKEYARQQVERRKREREEREKREKREFLKSNQYFIRCHKCNGHGVYCLENPTGVFLTHDKWFASYKALTQGWYHPAIFCQECYERGEATHLRVSTIHLEAGEVAFRIQSNHARRFVGVVEREEQKPMKVNS